MMTQVITTWSFMDHSNCEVKDSISSNY